MLAVPGTVGRPRTPQRSSWPAPRCPWADLHPAESIDDAVRFGDPPLAIAGAGAPLVAEFCVAEFAAAVGLPTEIGKTYLGEAVELRHRLPRTWARVRSGELAAWRARRIARETMALSTEAAGSSTTRPEVGGPGRPSPTGLVADRSPRYMPDQARRRREAAADGRHAHVHTHQVSFEGTVWVEAEVDLADALDLDTALWVGAARLADLGSAASLDVRRSEALGADGPPPARPGPRHPDRDPAQTRPYSGPDSRPSGRAARPPLRPGHPGRPGPTGCTWPGWRTPARFVDADQVRAWCGVPGTTVTVKPVVDLSEKIHVDQYEVPDRLAAQAAERDLTCVFPGAPAPPRPATPTM